MNKEKKIKIKILSTCFGGKDKTITEIIYIYHEKKTTQMKVRSIINAQQCFLLYNSLSLKQLSFKYF
jgi:hypothetical protein